MRLWHSKLIPLLDSRRLCDVHMSCCNLRGRGWGKRNVSINYLYDDPLGEEALAVYHDLVLTEMKHRGFHFDETWFDTGYCGRNRPFRIIDVDGYDEAAKREVPLLGHTYRILLSDIMDLKQRGLDIQARLEAGQLKITRNNIEVTYALK